MGLGWNNLPFDIPNHRAENGPRLTRAHWMAAQRGERLSCVSRFTPLPTSWRTCQQDSVSICWIYRTATIVPLDIKKKMRTRSSATRSTQPMRRVVEIAA